MMSFIWCARAESHQSRKTLNSFTDNFKELTGQDPLTVKYMFEHIDDFQVGERHSKDD